MIIALNIIIPAKSDELVKFTNKHLYEIEYMSKNILNQTYPIPRIREFEKKNNIWVYHAVVDKKEKDITHLFWPRISKLYSQNYPTTGLDDINALYYLPNEYDVKFDCFILYSTWFYKDERFIKNRAYYVGKKFNDDLWIICLNY